MAGVVPIHVDEAIALAHLAGGGGDGSMQPQLVYPIGGAVLDGVPMASIVGAQVVDAVVVSISPLLVHFVHCTQPFPRKSGFWCVVQGVEG